MKKFFSLFSCFVTAAGVALSGLAFMSNADTGYCDTPMLIAATSSTTTISYSSKSTDSYDMVSKPPRYTKAPYDSCCAPIAGANVIGYFDRYYEDLIPNHTAGVARGSKYLYNDEDDYITALVKELYTEMSTTSNGTTETNCKKGLRSYCSEKGYSVSFSSCMSGSSFSYSLAKSYMKNNKPIILFLSGYNVGTLSEGTNKDTVSYYTSSDTHVMIGFGCMQIDYTLSTGSTKTVQYISVSTGLKTNNSGLFNISYSGTITAAYAVNIY